jgi:2-oxoglutarate ferredoxin oxidoreductase subunit beta
MHYCPGCGHSIIHRLIAELLDEMNLRESAICVPPAGCAVLAYNYLDIDMVEAPHGRATAVATGIKRVLPHNLVFSYQGDGDLAAIGTAEALHTANRGEHITVIFVNNAVYGMTGGQMAPTTLSGQKTTTSPLGRNPKTEGPPIRVCELLAMLDNTTYLERTAVNSPAHIRQTKKAIRTAFEHQQKKTGFTLVEILSPCPTNWGMDPVQSCKWIDEVMVQQFPLGVVKETPC